MIVVPSLVILVGVVCSVKGQLEGGPWAQCGGLAWTGVTTCVSGYTCTVVNQYYSQCIPGPSDPPASTPTISSSQTGSPRTSTVVPGPAPTGKQIRVDQPPAYHLYLQNIGGIPTLGPESSSGYFDIGSTIALNNPDGTKLYLNVDTSASTAWKPVTLDSTAKTTTWGLSGDTIIYGNQQNFVVCPISGSANYNLSLSTSNDIPNGCTNWITIHLPCLC